MTRARYDVAIVGGAIIGSAVAYFVKCLAPAARVAVLERDSTYEFASTLRASGGARRQFSCPENIAMSDFSIPFIEHADAMLAVDSDPAHVEWRQGGYLLIAGPAALDTLRGNYDVQRAHGVNADWLDADALHARFPSMNLADIAAGVHTPEDGWCDPNGLLQGLRKKDTARLAFRPEGRGYSGGLVNSDEPRGYNFDVDHDYFEHVVWPALAHRFPAFEACRCPHMVGPVRAERARWQSGDWQLARPYREFLRRRGILGSRHDARPRSGPRHRGIDRASAIRHTRSRAARLSARCAPRTLSRTRNPVVPGRSFFDRNRAGRVDMANSLRRKPRGVAKCGCFHVVRRGVCSLTRMSVRLNLRLAHHDRPALEVAAR